MATDEPLAVKARLSLDSPDTLQTTKEESTPPTIGPGLPHFGFTEDHLLKEIEYLALRLLNSPEPPSHDDIAKLYPVI